MRMGTSGRKHVYTIEILVVEKSRKVMDPSRVCEAIRSVHWFFSL